VGGGAAEGAIGGAAVFAVEGGIDGCGGEPQAIND